MVHFSIPQKQLFKPNPLDNEARERLMLELRRCADCTRLTGATESSDPRSFLALPGNESYQKQIAEHAARVGASEPDIIVFIGIGGSMLGPSALYQAFKNSSVEVAPLLIFFDLMDSDALCDFFAFVHEMPELRIQVVIVSKSGKTVESSVNAACVLGFFEQAGRPLLSDQVTIITDYNSPLWVLAKSAGYHLLTIPSAVGGRYSVFSAVGLFLFSLFFPQKREELLLGAHSAIEDGTQEGERNSALASAQFLYACYQQGYVVHDSFIFGAEYETMGKWYRQLLGESIGKRVNKVGKIVETGMLPTVSIGSSDLHSMAQFYFGGPRIVVSTLIFFEPCDQKIHVPPNHPFSVVKHGPSVSSLTRGLFESVVRTYAKEGRPLMSWALSKKASDLGYFMQMKMLEVVYLAALLEVNAFDQPEVELYKNEARGLIGT